YRGVYRLPSYRLPDQEPIRTETAAMEEYVFGKIANEFGLIMSYETALQMLAKFAKTSREFEVIHCRKWSDCATDRSRSASLPGKPLGFDVAGFGGDFWSIVADFPDDIRVAHFFDKLNENGLFYAPDEATEYLDEYRRLRLPDYQSPFEVLAVRLME